MQGVPFRHNLLHKASWAAHETLLHDCLPTTKTEGAGRNLLIKNIYYTFLQLQ